MLKVIAGVLLFGTLAAIVYPMYFEVILFIPREYP